MLTVRSVQMKEFEDAALRRFEDEMVIHSQGFTPRLCEVLGEKQLRVALRQAMSRAQTYGFTNRGPMRLYIELMFLCGSDFDTDPQYPAIGEVLNASGDQMERAEQICDGVIDYQEKVSGPEGVNVRKALKALSVFAKKPDTVFSNDFDAEMLQEMTRAFPQKVDYTSKDRLMMLIEEGRAEAQKYDLLAGRAESMIVILMFAFGHGCTNDPLYPWIGRTLKDERIKDQTARAQRLEKKAVTWLDHVLARPMKGVQG